MATGKNNDVNKFIESLKESKKQLRFLLNLSDNLRYVSNPTEIHRIITEASQKYFKCDGCHYGEIYGNQMIIRKDLSKEKSRSTVGRYDRNLFPKYKAIIDSGKPLVIEDIYFIKTIEEKLKRYFIKREIISCIIIPVIKEDRTVGMLVIYQSRPRRWKKSEVRLAMDIAERTWCAVDRGRITEEKEKLFLQVMKERNKLEAIIESINAEVWISDISRNVSLIDSEYGQAAEIWKCDKHVDKLWDEVEFFSIDGRPWSKEDTDILKFLEGERISGEGIIKYKNIDKLMYREFRASPIKNGSGEVLGSVIISMDIADRIKTRQSLIESERSAKELVRKLEKTDELRLSFLSSLSHELRNPIATITMGLNLMDKMEDNKVEEERIRHMLKRQTKQLNKLVDDLLNMTRITKNTFEIELEELELNQLIEQIIEDSTISFDKKKIKVKRNITKDKIYIKGDPVRITQVIDNILDNALKFTPSNGEVLIKLEKDEENKVTISIKDNGEGMSKELIKDIFEPYVQARNSMGKSSAGLGIGLSIVKDIVERHKGSIRVLSEGREKGTEFIINLPTI